MPRPSCPGPVQPPKTSRMTRQFILDENVIILAQRKEDPQGNSDATCLSLLLQIINICHTIVVDVNLWTKYQQQLGRIPAAGFGPPNLFHVIQGARQRAGKFSFLENAPPFPEETNIPQGSQDDTEIVRLAVATGATLVTTDNPLIEDLAYSGITDAYQLQVVLPEDALPLLYPLPSSLSRMPRGSLQCATVA